MEKQLQELQLDLVSYREAVDKIFSSALSKPEEWQLCLRDILIRATQLYLHYQLFIKALPGIKATRSKGRKRLVKVDVSREKSLRGKIAQRFQSSACWTRQFKPENSFSEFTGLRTKRDYTDSFQLHLPEIYEEAIRVETCAKEFIANHDDAALAQIEIGLQHLGRNHISFVLQALEWASDEGSWLT